MAVYNSIHTGGIIDNFDNRITTNTNNIATKADKAEIFTITLTTANWSNNAQTISNNKFVSSGYCFTVSPTSSSFKDYAEAIIYADNITTDGSITFHCVNVPITDLTVNIKKEMCL